MLIYRGDDFFEKEKDCALFERNYGFFEFIKNNPNNNILENIKKWPLIVSAKNIENVKFLKIEDVDRIFIVDAERIFASEKYRTQLIQITSYLSDLFGDYQQNISFIVSFLLLFIPPNEVVHIMKFIREDEKYIPGHFESASIGAKTDSILFMKVLSQNKEFEKISNKLIKAGVPSDFFKKWFSGLCVFILPFDSLYLYFENFFKFGFVFLLKFGFAFMKYFEKQILEAKGVEELLYLFDLNSEIIIKRDNLNNEDGAYLKMVSKKIINLALTDEYYFLNDLDIVNMRKDIYEKEIKPKIDLAKKFEKENPVEEIQLCEICNDNLYDIICEKCEFVICEDCYSKDNINFEKTHKIKALSDTDIENDESDDLVERVSKIKLDD